MDCEMDRFPGAGWEIILAHEGLDVPDDLPERFDLPLVMNQGGDHDAIAGTLALGPGVLAGKAGGHHGHDGGTGLALCVQAVVRCEKLIMPGPDMTLDHGGYESVFIREMVQKTGFAQVARACDGIERKSAHTIA